MENFQAVVHRTPPPPPPRPPRKAIQIVACTGGHGHPFFYALCNDGTIWQLTTGGQWVEMPAIPQSEVPA